jgi:hypothetical protein
LSKNNNRQVISGLVLISPFSKRILSRKLIFYLAQTYFSEGQKTSLFQNNYQYVEAPRIEFTEQSLALVVSKFW